MDGQAIMSVSAAVVTLTQLFKWIAVVPDKWGPASVLVLAGLGVALWGFSFDDLYERKDAFDYFAGWIAVATSSAGVFGFTRAASGAVTEFRAPPAGGAGQNPTIKE